MDRREILKGLGWLAGVAVASMPRNSYSLSPMPTEQLQRTLGYLGYMQPEWMTGFPDELTERALIRFKRHASRPYRISSKGIESDLPPSERFTGEIDSVLTESTVLEMQRWLDRGWKLPLNRFKLASLADEGKPATNALKWALLREDAAKSWKAAMREAERRGATLAEPYGDTARPLGYDRKEGVSRTSNHICGRAVDINQRFGQGRGQRYFLEPEPYNDRTRFRLYCLTAMQNGSQGVLFDDGKVRIWRAGARGEMFLPRGWYVDLTSLLDTFHFERISAHQHWEKYDIYSEWWHYQYNVEKQETFLDECELIGISEKQLMRANYTVDEMDHEPG